MSGSSPLFGGYSSQTQVTLHSALRFAQISSVIVPPAYLVSTLLLRRRPFSIRRFMYTSTVGTGLGGLAGAGLGWSQTQGENELATLARVERLRHDAGQIRTNDYSLISAALSALIVPTIFLRRAPLVSLVTGGASIGLGVGVLAHLFEGRAKGENVGPGDLVKGVPAVEEKARR